MTKNKAFTIVELIIVIAVIGVLAAILIPTFSNVIKKANAKSALSDARNTLTEYIAEQAENDALPESIVIFVEKASKYYVYGYSDKNGKQLTVADNNGAGYEYQTLSDLVADLNLTTIEYDNGVAAVNGGASVADAFGNKVFYLYPAGSKAMELDGFIDVSAELPKMNENVKAFDGVVVNAELEVTPTVAPTPIPPAPTVAETPTATVTPAPTSTPLVSGTPASHSEHEYVIWLTLQMYNIGLPGYDESSDPFLYGHGMNQTLAFGANLSLGNNRIKIEDIYCWPNFLPRGYQCIRVAKGDETLTPIGYIDVELTDVNRTDVIPVSAFVAFIPAPASELPGDGSYMARFVLWNHDGTESYFTHYSAGVSHRVAIMSSFAGKFDLNVGINQIPLSTLKAMGIWPEGEYDGHGNIKNELVPVAYNDSSTQYDYVEVELTDPDITGYIAVNVYTNLVPID